MKVDASWTKIMFFQNVFRLQNKQMKFQY